jgi:hypothetical protein
MLGPWGSSRFWRDYACGVNAMTASPMCKLNAPLLKYPALAFCRAVRKICLSSR